MSADDSMWAPPGEGDGPSERSPLDPDSLPAAPSQWAPPTPEPPAPFTPPTPPSETAAAAPTGDAPAAPPESVVVGPVEATSVSGSTRVGRFVAAGLAVAMVGGGAYLAFGAASADGGADSPEAAFEQALEAIEAGDLVALAEVMEPGERDTVFDAGFSFLDEMVRLEVLDEDFDPSAIDGVDLSLAGPDLSVERPRDDLARIYVGSGVLDVGVDVADLPLGRRMLELLTPEQQSFTDREIDVLQPQESPLVAVQREGRWYLSLWYTAAENARLAADLPLPDLLERPAPIGAESPEAAAARFLEEVARLDLARMIGMLDPEETAALYDYAPLFLDDASAAANEFLESAQADGWSWGFDELVFRADTDGDLATVYLERLTFRATGQGGSASVTIADDELAAELTLIDEFWGEETAWSVSTADGCLRVIVRSGETEDRIDSCDESAAAVGSSVLELQELGVVARRVDGRWYLSPVRTVLDTVIAAFEQLDATDLDGVFGEALFLPDAVLGDEVSFGSGIVEPEADLRFFEPATLVNADLLADDLDVGFAYDLDPEQAAWELSFFAPGLEAIDVERGAYATVDGGLGEVAVVSVEVADPEQADEVLRAFIADRPGVATLADNGGIRISFQDDFDDPVYVDLTDGILTLVGVYGADADAAFAVLQQQTAR